MLKRHFSLVLIAVFLHVPGSAPARAQSKADAHPPAAEQIRRKVYARGTGESARVSVELADGTKLKGYISEVAADHFVVMRTDAQRGRAVKIDYREARKLKLQGKGLSPSKKGVLPGMGVAVGPRRARSAYSYWHFGAGLKPCHPVVARAPCRRVPALI